MPISKFPLPSAESPSSPHRFRSLVAGINRYFGRLHHQSVLSNLDDHQLKDIGLNRDDIRGGRLPW